MSEDLQFDRAEFATAPTASCGACQAVLTDTYYQANSRLLCGSCADGLKNVLLGSGSRFGRVAKALLLGFGAAIVGALIHFSVLHFLQINAALVTILMGWLVGKAVRNGSGGRGGWRYQIMAVMLTYLSIAVAYVPMVIMELRNSAATDPAKVEQVVAADNVAAPVTEESSAETPAPPTAAPGEPEVTEVSTEAVTPAAAIGGVFLVLSLFTGLLFSLPVFIGMDSPFSLLIFGFGLFQAWQMNKKAVVDVTGPHAMSERQI